MTDTAPATDKTPRERSPSFPFISLGPALQRLVEFEKTFTRQEPPANRTYLAWGMKGDTSQAQQTLAALKAFGLVDYKGSGVSRPVAISDDGRTYLRAQQESVKREVVKRVALKPKWIAHFWNVWGTDRVPDPIRLDTLVLQHKFNESAAPTFLKVYDATIGYAGLGDSDKVGSVDVAEEPSDGLLPTLEVGDLIQVEINGVLTPKAVRVRAIQQYDGKPWVFVDDSESGIPMEHVRFVEQKGQGGSGPTPPTLPLPADPRLPPTPAATDDPYRIAFTPSGGLEGGFRVNSAADLDELVDRLTALKFFFKKVDDTKPPTPSELRADLGHR